MAAITQLIGSALPGRRYGSFAGKAGGPVGGPYTVAAVQVFCAGPAAGDTYTAGPTTGQLFNAGIVAGQVETT